MQRHNGTQMCSPLYGVHGGDDVDGGKELKMFQLEQKKSCVSKGFIKVHS